MPISVNILVEGKPRSQRELYPGETAMFTDHSEPPITYIVGCNRADDGGRVVSTSPSAAMRLEVVDIDGLLDSGDAVKIHDIVPGGEGQLIPSIRTQQFGAYALKLEYFSLSPTVE